MHGEDVAAIRNDHRRLDVLEQGVRALADVISKLFTGHDRVQNFHVLEEDLRVEPGANVIHGKASSLDLDH